MHASGQTDIETPNFEPPVVSRLAGLAADVYGSSDSRHPLVLLHGLTFNRGLWGPVLAELLRIDPGRRVLVLDLPGHGDSPAWPSYDIDSVAEGVHQAVEEMHLQAPVVVGHSIAAMVEAMKPMKLRHACRNASARTPRLPVPATTGGFSCTVTDNVLIAARVRR